MRGAILSLRKYYYLLFGMTRQRKLFMLTNLCHQLRRPSPSLQSEQEDGEGGGEEEEEDYCHVRDYRSAIHKTQVSK